MPCSVSCPTCRVESPGTVSLVLFCVAATLPFTNKKLRQSLVLRRGGTNGGDSYEQACKNIRFHQKRYIGPNETQDQRPRELKVTFASHQS
jgi:hypothetical protein